MLIKVSLDELVDSPKLEFNLYGPNGNVLFPAGSDLPRGEIRQLRNTSIYRDFRSLPFNHEGLEFPLADAPMTAGERAQGLLENDLETIFDPESTRMLFNSIEGFWTKMAEGSTPDVALCELVRDKMVAELTCNVEQVHTLTQLRVRDAYTFSHTLHVAALSIALAIKVGMSDHEVREIGLAAILHDLGKFLIPKPIMFKPGRLTEKEFEVMKLHPGFGYNIIVNDLRLPEHIARPALEHQEMHGGGGYPQNLKGDEIHPYSQIVKIADVYEALTAKRPYKDPIPSTKAMQIMRSEVGKSFNPELLESFSELANFQEPPPEPEKTEPSS